MTISELTTFDFDAILRLYSSAGWTNYTEKPELLKKAYENSLLTLGAYDGNKLVGVSAPSAMGFLLFLFRIFWFFQNISVEE